MRSLSSRRAFRRIIRPQVVESARPSATPAGQSCATYCVRAWPPGGYSVPELPASAPFRYEPVTDVDLHGVGAVVYTTGFRPDCSWIDHLAADELGYPVTVDGASPAVRGLFFCGVHFMRIRRSGFLFGVGEDAAIVADLVAGQPGGGAAVSRVVSR